MPTLTIKVLETHKLQDGTIKGTFAFPEGTLRRDSVEFEDAPTVTLTTETSEVEQPTDPLKQGFLVECGRLFDGMRERIREEQAIDMFEAENVERSSE